MNYYYEFVYNLFAGKSIQEQAALLIRIAFIILVLSFLFSKLIRWIKKKLK